MSIHEGHRQRLKERFRREGLDNFDELYVLELLLFYCVPRKDTNPLAHRLLEHFGSLTGVLDASAEELEKVEDVGKNISTFLTLIKETGRYYETKSAEIGDIMYTVEDCGKYLQPRFLGRVNEMVYLLCLDAKCKVLCCKKISEGSVNSANISIRKIVETALNSNATSVVLAHNHPSGFAHPSGEDIETTMQLARALRAVEVTLVDHLVFAGDEYVSVAQSERYSSALNGEI